MARVSFPTLSQNQGNQMEWMRRLTIAVNQLLNGKSNAAGSVTLTENQTTTDVTDAKVGGDSIILLSLMLIFFVWQYLE